jgi:uncharacterized protein YndB with AHSA1/START domain
MTHESTGRLTIEGDRAVLTFERRLPYPIEAVWSAITDPAQRNRWFGETTIDTHEGGTIDMVPSGPPVPPQQKRMTGRIRVWDSPYVLEHEWHEAITEPGWSGTNSTPTATGRCCGSVIGGWVSEARPVSFPEPTHSLTGSRHTSPAQPYRTGRSAITKSPNR